jgi:hypothetical protein
MRPAYHEALALAVAAAREAGVLLRQALLAPGGPVGRGCWQRRRAGASWARRAAGRRVPPASHTSG